MGFCRSLLDDLSHPLFQFDPLEVRFLKWLAFQSVGKRQLGCLEYIIV